ncbi:hypothetical protein VTP01DRAFT_3943 [Rhizomucor pusillus]|uniref:uncharacterized protein n=1 Tax=Rhizomucor pusillus TaxID=4840 RepID=UPI0037448B10
MKTYASYSMMIGICDHRCTFLCPSFGWCHSIWQLIIEGGSACTPSESMPRKDSGTFCGPLIQIVESIAYGIELTWHSAVGKVPEHYKTPGYSKILSQSCFSSNV